MSGTRKLFLAALLFAGLYAAGNLYIGTKGRPIDKFVTLTVDESGADSADTDGRRLASAKKTKNKKAAIPWGKVNLPESMPADK